ncbi:nuclear transport factor 2 family protein [Aquimarina sp. 2304DJ70-9]|uniref:nuclear transport factor 2 family protein n=1 Tax=Aquimarina penaris TaxID=3231044 RepID=UPI003462BFED
MKIIKTILPLLFVFIFTKINSQTESIQFELNGRNATDISKNPFGKFIGEWALKDDIWTHNWGNGTETIKIPKHHTVSKQMNTNNSLLSIIDGPEPNGHIFWSYNPNTKEVHHLSSFGTIRAGNGSGTIHENGDVQLKLIFEGEPAGTYRIYNYKWLNENEYHMKSVQFNANDEPTGLFYEGNFVRLDLNKNDTLKKEITKLLKVLDDNHIEVKEQLNVYSNDIVHMAPNNPVITNKEDLKHYLEEQRKYGTTEMKHQIVEIEPLGNKILMRGMVTGTFNPSNGEKPFEFKTKNLFVFEKIKGALKISKVIYNISPNN